MQTKDKTRLPKGLRGRASISSSKAYRTLFTNIDIDVEPKWTWRDELKRCRGTFNGPYTTATKRMKEKYPGNYRVEDYYDSETLSFDLRLKFDTPEDETFFHLKYE